MAKLITKFKYLKPNARTSARGYAKYIATREGVDKIDQSFKLTPSSLKQQQLIEKILTDFPDSKEMLEYEDYLKEPTVGNASEFITRALEDNSYEVMQTKTYADYIATRTLAQRFGSHGLFTDDGVQIKLNDVSDKLNHYDGNVWTVIISIRREDAERLGFNKGERWRDMPNGQFVVMKTGVHPMRVRLKLFYKWGIQFDKDNPYTVTDNGGREVEYAEKQEIIEGIMKKYRKKEYEEMKEAEAAATAGGQDQAESQSNEPQQTPPQKSSDKKKGGNDLKTEPPSRRHSPPNRAKQEVKPSEQT